MKTGNRAQLETERLALRDAFDAVWIASPTMTPVAARAVKAAIKLDVRDDAYRCTFIGAGWRLTAMGVIPHAPCGAMAFGNDLASAARAFAVRS